MSTNSGSAPKWKRGWSQAHEEFQTADRELTSGTGLKFHSFSNLTLGDNTEKDAYIKATGLQQTTTTQTWGSQPAARLYRSRRGSISGFTTLQSGEVQGWRLHSLPTSEALKNASINDAPTFEAHYKQRAALIDKPWTNSAGKDTTANSVLSDIGKVGFNTGTTKFTLDDVTHAKGVSGIALSEPSAIADKRVLYQPSIATAKKRDPSKEPRPEATFHSEPAALTLHNKHRTTKVQDDSGLVGAFASFPNQVCKQCGETFHAFGGEGSYITGEPGRPFGGQKVGEGSFAGKGAAVFRATPARELLHSSNTTNKPEVESIFKYHHANRPKASLSPLSAPSSTSSAPQALVLSPISLTPLVPVLSNKRKAIGVPSTKGATSSKKATLPPPKKSKLGSVKKPPPTFKKPPSSSKKPPPKTLKLPPVATPPNLKKRAGGPLPTPNPVVPPSAGGQPALKKIKTS
jgi:hypothetical protein